MAKITQLPLAVGLDGSETIVMVKDNITRRAALGGLIGAAIAPHVSAAELARDQAASLVTPENRFVAADLLTASAAGEAAVAVGTYFIAVGKAEGEAEVRLRTAGGSELIYTEITKAALNSIDPGKGASLIRLEEGVNVEQRFRGVVLTHQSAGILGGDEAPAIQEKLNAAGPYGAVKIKGDAILRSGIVLGRGQKLIGETGQWFINTNDGTTWQGQNTGQTPWCGLYFDMESGEAIRLGEGAELQDLHIYGKGYTTLGVDIQKPNPPAQYPVTGIVKEKFANLTNVSIFYFDTALHSLAGDYYSRHSNVEITRCTIGERFDAACFNQLRIGCVMRVVELPFSFGAGCEMHLIGTSIEGFSRTIDLRSGSLVSISDCYFETFNDLATLPALWRAVASNVTFSVGGTRIYLSHVARFFDSNNQAALAVTDRGGNQVVNGSGSNNAVAVMFQLPATLRGGSFNLGGGSQIVYYDGDTRASTTGSAALNSSTLTVASAIVEPGQRLRIVGGGPSGADLITMATAVAGTAVTLRDAVFAALTNAVVYTYSTVNYVQHGMGFGLLQFGIKWPMSTVSPYTLDEMAGVSSFGMGARTEAPTRPFGSSANGFAVYGADGTSWNPAGRGDGRGPYPTVLRGGRYYPMVGPVSGEFTMGAAASTVVSNIYVSANSVILFEPRNQAAATLLGTKGLLVTAHAAGESFTVSVADGSPAAGTELFRYLING